ncbi:MAG TPA: FAD-dependent oxidoreductase [Candidatus Paceibacterota bacterium]|nr:FAD-dependent oxidoreductase [Candidatus Paceibacterota bacterium]
MIYDLIILGGGPAGTAAAVYAARKRLKTLFITAEWGGQSTVSEEIFNWIGTVSISGDQLAKNLKSHVMANVGDTLEVKEGYKVGDISKSTADGKDIFKIKTDDGMEFSAKTVLISTGSTRRPIDAKNADKLEHKGLTYCASCDGPLFSGMDVAVIGGGNAAFETAAQLLAYCNSVTLFVRGEHFRADEITVEKVMRNPKMRVVMNSEILEIKGENFVSGLVYHDKVTGSEIELNVAGIFVEIGQIPNTAFAKNVVTLDEIGRIKIDPRTGKTETPGIWAAGDCTDVLYHQNNIAAGDAVRALEDIYLAIHTK